MEFICGFCKSPFERGSSRAKHGRGKYCSRKCMYLGARTKTKKIERKCPVCQKNFTIYPSAKKAVNYCSRKCHIEAIKIGKAPSPPKVHFHPKTKIPRKCLICKREYYYKNKRQKYCSRSCFEVAHRENMCGSKNPAYKDGSSYTKRCYRGPNWDKVRLDIYRRDNFTCRQCGVRCVGRRGLKKENWHRLIQCHHIKNFKTEIDNDQNNLITLCARCHIKEHSISCRKGKHLLCDICNQIFYVRRYRLGKGVRYCSIKCKGIASRKSVISEGIDNGRIAIQSSNPGELPKCD